MSVSFENDLNSWLCEELSILGIEEADKYDISAIAKEIEGLRHSTPKELGSCFRLILLHFFKMAYHPEGQQMSWKITILLQRKNLIDCIEANPIPRDDVDDAIKTAYEEARILASNGTGIQYDALPEQCPWTFEQLIDNEFYPG